MAYHFFRLLPFFSFVQQRFREDRCVQFAASLTYTTLLALVPIVTIALMILSAFPVFTELTTQLKVFILSNFVPSSAGKIISVYMRQFSEQAAHLTALGVALLGVTAFMLMLTIDHAFNVIWRVRRQRSLPHRLLIYWAALTLGPLLIGASLSLTSYLVSLSLGLVKGVPLIDMITLKMVPILLTILAFALLYLIVPSRAVSSRHALIGGVVAGLAFELMKMVFTFYLSHFPTYKLVYGAFAIVPIFLLWIYLSWLVVLSGAEIAAALPHWNIDDGRKEKAVGREFFAALAILQALYKAQQVGKLLSLQRLQQGSDLAPEEVEDILDRLNALKWVSDVKRDSWVMTRSADAIRLAEIYREFVFDPEKMLSSCRDAREERLLSNLAASLDGVLGLSLQEFSQRV